MCQSLRALYLHINGILSGSSPDRRPLQPIQEIVQMVCTILNCIKSKDVPYTVEVVFAIPHLYTYRVGMLEAICGDHVVAALRRSPMLQQLSYRFWDNDSKFDKWWWTEQSSCRLPDDIRSTVSVIVSHKQRGTCFTAYFPD